VYLKRKPFIRVCGYVNFLLFGFNFSLTYHESYATFSGGSLQERNEMKGIMDANDFESREHTLAEFVAESMNFTIVPEGLPKNVSAEKAGRRFGEMKNVLLESLGVNEHYFCGWFNEGGRKIMTTDGKHLFTLFGPESVKKFFFRDKISIGSIGSH